MDVGLGRSFKSDSFCPAPFPHIRIARNHVAQCGWILARLVCSRISGTVINYTPSPGKTSGFSQV